MFAFDRPDVRAFLIGNARMFLDEYHADGLRFDEVSVIDAKGGWSFCQDLTQTLRYDKPAAALIAEYWGEHPWLAVWRPPDGMGFDLGYADGLRDGVRGVLAQVAGGASAPVDLDRLRRGLERPWNLPFAWQAYNCIENHDLVLDADGDHRQAADRQAGRLDQLALLVRAQPRARGHRPAADRPGRADAVHGPGVPRGQAVVGQPEPRRRT